MEETQQYLDVLRTLFGGSLLGGQLSFLLLAIFLFLTLGCYVKIVTVLSVLRVGLGFGSLPSWFVTSSLALMLSLFVMFPTLQTSLQSFDHIVKEGGGDEQARVRALEGGLEKWKAFLLLHAHQDERDRFAKVAEELDHRNALKVRGSAENAQEASVDANKKPIPISSIPVSSESWRVLAPAFLVSELKEAFATGLSLFLPFLVVELVVANLLLAVGYSQLAPCYVAFPFKLLLFVLVDGWGLITSNLVLSYGR